MAAVLLSVGLAGCGYTQLQYLEERVATARAEIEIQLQRRGEIVPGLLESIEAHGELRGDIAAAVSEARTQLMGNLRAGDLSGMQTANRSLQRAVDALLAAASEDSALSADPSFRILRNQLETTEDRFAEARRAYNEAVSRFNAFIAEFPQLVTAKVIGARPLEPLEEESTSGPLPSPTDSGPD